MESSEFIPNKKEHQSKQVLIGSGGTCDLFRVMIHNKFHVLKKLKEEHKDSQPYIESLRREFEIGFQLDHPNIVRYLEFNANQNEQSILLEFIDGATLADTINKQSISLTIEQKRRIIFQLCNAVEYLHSKQTYHLDLKPENILITFRGKNLKLIDFGHSLTDGNNTKVGGTKSYSRSSLAEKSFDATDDIYAIGKIIEFLYSNEPDKVKSLWKPIIDSCITDSINKFKSIEELTGQINELKEDSKRPIFLYAVIATLVIISFVFYLNQTTENQLQVKNQQFPIDNNSDTLSVNTQSEMKETTSMNTLQLEREVSVDSAYCTELGTSLYGLFVIAYSKSDKTIKSGSTLQTQLTDSIQSIWFDYSSKFVIGSKEHESAYNYYFPNFNDSQQKIMQLLYGSE